MVVENNKWLKQDMWLLRAAKVAGDEVVDGDDPNLSPLIVAVANSKQCLHEILRQLVCFYALVVLLPIKKKKNAFHKIYPQLTF